MRQVIDGRIYDTDKAESIWDRRHLGPSDSHYLEEAIYRTPRGRWFLAGKGGPMSKYAEFSWKKNPHRQSGSGIKTLSKDAALAWMETHAPADLTELFTLEEA
jgi:hypothetical protein